MSKGKKIADVYETRKIGEIHQKKKTSVWAWIGLIFFVLIIIGAISD